MMLSAAAIYVPYHVFAEDNNDSAYLNSGLPFFIVQSSYHEAMNDYFNNKLYLLGKILDKNEFYSDENFNAPADVDTENFAEKCGKDNVSTFCVSMGALEIYNSYLVTLSEMKEKLPAREEDSDVISLDRLYIMTSQRNQVISEEIINSEKVLMATVSAYNEYRIAFPVHRQNQEIIKSLTKYKRALIYLRRMIAQFPSKFIDASSATCN